LDAQHVVQTNDGPFEAMAGHAVEVISSHPHLPLSNVEGMSSIPPLLDDTLYQGGTCGPFQQKAKDKLKARFINVSPRFENEEVIPLHHLVGTSSTSIRG